MILSEKFIHIGIGFVTGRKHFQNVLRTYVNNWLEHGLVANERIRLHVFVAYDLKYFNTIPSDYKNVSPELSKHLDSIHFFGQSAIKDEMELLQEKGIVNATEAEMLFGEGYAKKRNTVMYFALKNNMDRFIFLDDDEYPQAVLENSVGQLYWMGQGVLSTHLHYSAEADITHGRHCGYISPIPVPAFNEQFQESDFQLFIEALSNDILSWDHLRTVLLDQQGVTFASEQIVQTPMAEEVPMVNGLKFISGANLCLNLNRIGKKLPPFYNPPGARGEDTFFSACLAQFSVLRVPCYTFHDGFLLYGHLLQGVLPTELQGVDAKVDVILERFIKACIGWVRYKPLLLYITEKDSYDVQIAKVKKSLEAVIPKFCAYFETSKFEQLLLELDYYDANVRLHHADFLATRKAWLKVLEHTVTPARKEVTLDK